MNLDMNWGFGSSLPYGGSSIKIALFCILVSIKKAGEVNPLFPARLELVGDGFREAMGELAGAVGLESARTVEIRLKHPGFEVPDRRGL